MRSRIDFRPTFEPPVVKICSDGTYPLRRFLDLPLESFFKQYFIKVDSLFVWRAQFYLETVESIDMKFGRYICQLFGLT